MKKQNRPGRRGFTLVELLVVIAIIAIIASITLVSLIKYRERAQTARVNQEVASFQKAAAVFYADHQKYPNPISAIAAGTGVTTDYCLGTSGGVPQKCCISMNGCSYQGSDYLTLPPAGEFASAQRAPAWLAFFAERAEAILGNALPQFLTEAPVSPSGFKGIFYDCIDTDCSDAHVYFTVPQESCSRGTSHDTLSGVCVQDIVGTNGAGSSGVDSENCANDTDDDGDGAIDCDDSDCTSSPSCSTPENCSAAGDEDSDGHADCADSDCAGQSDPTGSFNCQSPETSCSDSYDNDADGCADSGDASCGGSESSYCADSVDNDCDGTIDCSDSDCSAYPACVPTPEDCSTASTDEDGDGYPQCGDPDCFGNGSYCSSETSGDATCSDGKNNDADSYGADCNDPDCSSAPNCVATPEDCSTGSTDEDGDGQPQCGDSDCGSYSSSPSWSSETYYTYSYCSGGSLQSSSGGSSGLCYDGQDNDVDGCADTVDVDCGGNESGESACSNSSDDDCDGAMNCSDGGCAGTEACDPNNCACGSPYGTYTCGEFGTDYCGDDPSNCSCY